MLTYVQHLFTDPRGRPSAVPLGLPNRVAAGLHCLGRRPRSSAPDGCPRPGTRRARRRPRTAVPRTAIPSGRNQAGSEGEMRTRLGRCRLGRCGRVCWAGTWVRRLGRHGKRLGPAEGNGLVQMKDARRRYCCAPKRPIGSAGVKAPPSPAASLRCRRRPTVLPARSGGGDWAVSLAVRNVKRIGFCSCSCFLRSSSCHRRHLCRGAHHSRAVPPTAKARAGCGLAATAAAAAVRASTAAAATTAGRTVGTRITRLYRLLGNQSACDVYAISSALLCSALFVSIIVVNTLVEDAFFVCDVCVGVGG